MTVIIFGGWRYTSKKWTVHRIMCVVHDVIYMYGHFSGYTSIHRKTVTVITYLI